MGNFARLEILNAIRRKADNPNLWLLRFVEWPNHEWRAYVTDDNRFMRTAEGRGFYVEHLGPRMPTDYSWRTCEQSSPSNLAANSQITFDRLGWLLEGRDG